MDEKVMHEKLTLLGLPESPLLCDKVREIYRKLLTKLPTGSLGRSEIARPTLSIEIACRLLSMPVSHDMCARVCRVTQAEYTRLLNTCKIALGISWGSSNVEQVLSLQFSAELVEESKRILVYYNSAYVALLPSDARRYVVLDSALYKCAAFCVAAAATRSQIKFDKAAIAGIAEVTVGQLTKVAESIRSVWSRRAEEQRNGASRKRSLSPLSGADKENVVNSSGYETGTSAAGGKATATVMKSASRHSEIMEQLRQRNLNAMNSATALVDKTGSAVLNHSSGACVISNGGSRTADAGVSIGASGLTAATTVDIGLGQGQEGQGQGQGAAAREAYEVWREAMRARKRAKVEQSHP